MQQKCGELSLAGGGLQTDSQATSIAFADRLSFKILFLGQGQMYYTPFAGIHGTENERRGRRPNLARRVLSHRPEFSFARSSVVIGVADDPLTLWQCPPKRLIKNLLQRIEQLTALIQEQAAVRSVD